MENLVNIIIELFKTKLGSEVTVFIISMLPILELRGGLLASTLLNIEPLKGFILCFIGNILPIPFIMYFITPIFDRLKKTKKLSKLVYKIENKAISKKEQIEKYKYLGLLLFVGIPLPGTGAWTGCLIASILGMDKKKSMIYATLGVLLAGTIMMIISYGIIGNII